MDEATAFDEPPEPHPLAANAATPTYATRLAQPEPARPVVLLGLTPIAVSQFVNGLLASCPARSTSSASSYSAEPRDRNA